MSSNTTTTALIFLALATLTSFASAQDYSEDANYGDIELEGFFAADPVQIIPGGNQNISHIDNCVGYVSNAPDLEVNVVDGAVLPLNFYAVSDTDTILLINDPNGNWHCNDDFGDGSGINPGIEFPEPQSGVYDVWVGTYSDDSGSDSATLHILSFTTPWSDDFTDFNSETAGSGESLDFSLDAYNSASLESSFAPDPYTVSIAAGGSISADYIDSCTGFASAAPDLELEYSDAGIFELGIFVTGSTDTTLIVNDPSGNWHCNDDFDLAGGTNPGVVFSSPQSGTYDVWVGTYSEDDIYADVDLIVTELGAPWTNSNGSGSETIPNNPAPSTGGPIGSGTGFLVSNTGHILTNHHVIDGCSRQTFQIRGEVAFDATLLSSNAATDLALLKTDIQSAPATFRGTEPVRLGEEVVVYGFPLLGDLSSQGNLTNGIVSALSGLNDDLSRMQMTAQIQPGNSGGPVMNRNGDIVGVVVETANTEFFEQQRGTSVQNLNFAIRDSLALSFLDTNNVDYQRQSAAASERAIADIAEQAQNFTGIIRCYQ